MTRSRAKNTAASVMARLLRLSKERAEDLNAILLRFGTERLMFRLSTSPHRDRFVVKGAFLFAAWTGETHRPTKDLDLLARGTSEPEDLVEVFSSLCLSDVEGDGLTFDARTIETAPIRESFEYPGTRLTMEARLGSARIPLQVDIAVGDVMTPRPTEAEFSVTLIGFSTPRLKAYSRETVVAEKLEAMVKLGRANGRMKDFFDVWVLAMEYAFDAELLSQAVASTFARRGTSIPAGVPEALTAVFLEDPQTEQRWRAFISRNRLERTAPGSAAMLRPTLEAFIVPVLNACHDGNRLQGSWDRGGPWLNP